MDRVLGVFDTAIKSADQNLSLASIREVAQAAGGSFQFNPRDVDSVINASRLLESGLDKPMDPRLLSYAENKNSFSADLSTASGIKGTVSVLESGSVPSAPNSGMTTTLFFKQDTKEAGQASIAAPAT